MPELPQTILLYGESDSGKTAQCGELAKYHHALTGEISRMIVGDSTVDPVKDLLITPENPGGIIQPCNVKGMRDPWNRLELMARGYWPRIVSKPDGSFNIIMDPLKVENDRIVLDDGRKIGQYFVEGLSTISRILLQDHADHADSRPMWGSGKEGVTMFESEALVSKAGQSTPVIEKIKIGRAIGGHYGSVQHWMLEVLIPRFAQLRLVSRVIWTAHTARGKDDFTGMEGKALGPATVGQATVDRTTQNFGHSFHLEVETSFDTKASVKRDFRAWFVSHPDRELKTLNWPAKVSVSVGKAKELLRKFPGGFIPLNDHGMEQFLEFLESSKPEVKS